MKLKSVIFIIVTVLCCSCMSPFSAISAGFIPEHGVSDNCSAERWENGSLTGNGIQGAIVMGRPVRELIVGTHSGLFLPLGNCEVLPDMAPYLKEFRELIRTDGYMKAYDFFYEKAAQQGYPGLSWSDPFVPTFRLNVAVSANAGIGNYIRTTDFETGEINVVTGNRDRLQRKLFVSRADNLYYYNLQNTSSKKVKVSLSFKRLPDKRVIEDSYLIKDGVISVRYRYLNGKGGYDVFLRVLSDDTEVKSVGKALSVTGEGKITVAFTTVPVADLSQPQQLPAELQQASDNYSAALDAHVVQHRRLFKSTELKLGGADFRADIPEKVLLKEAARSGRLSAQLVQEIYEAARFYIICSTGLNPPNLQGIWSNTFDPAWSGDFTTDTNVQLAVAHLLSAGNEELLLSLFDLMESQLPQMRENAKKLYGCRGIMLSTRTSNNGLHLHWDHSWPGQLWTCGAGWIAHWYWDYYLYTGDIEFLKQRAIPFMKETALFLEDFLIEDPDFEDGRLLFTPSYSAEQPWGDYSTDNSTQDIAVARELFTNLIKASEITGAENENIEKWKKLLAQLPPYIIHPDGYLQEWAYEGAPDFPNHKHFSVLYAVINSFEFTPEKTPELWDAAVQTFERRMSNWFYVPGTDNSSHGRMHASLAAAYLGRGQVISDALLKMVQGDIFYKNLHSCHNEGGHVFNADSMGAIPEILHNSLVFSDGSEFIDILPVPTSILEKGEISGIKLRGGRTVQKMNWDNSKRIIELEIICSKNEELILRMRQFPGAKFYLMQNSEEISISGEAGPSEAVIVKSGQKVKIRIDY